MTHGIFRSHESIDGLSMESVVQGEGLGLGPVFNEMMAAIEPVKSVMSPEQIARTIGEFSRGIRPATEEQHERHIVSIRTQMAYSGDTMPNTVHQRQIDLAEARRDIGLAFPELPPPLPTPPPGQQQFEVFA